MRAKSIALQRTEPHPSYNVVVSAALHPTNGIPRKPMELVEMAEAAASAQVAVSACTYLRLWKFPVISSLQMDFDLLHACQTSKLSSSSFALGG